MSRRQLLAITSSGKSAEMIVSAAMEDFPVETIARIVTHIEGVGWCEKITVDADDYDRWIASR
jgi:hypothetical protein